MTATATETAARREGAAPRAPEAPVVEFRDVTKAYPDGVVGLERASMRIGRGELVFLVGPSGSGKSTCLRLLLKDIEPSEGEVLVAGRRLAGLPRRKVPYLRRNMGVVLPNATLLPDRTVYANIAYELEAIGQSRAQVRRSVPNVLGLVALWRKRHRYPGELSRDEQQRVAIARACVNRPPLLLADEPAAGLDPDASIAILQLLARVNRTGTTVVVATRDRAMVARTRRRAIELRDGRVVGERRPDLRHAHGRRPQRRPRPRGQVRLAAPGRVG